ncbi:MAG: alanine-glyoxylate transaminase/serine-glyoxylate transaminase/serine-pyruvate transaminase [Granulosicoccus sp.]|jgi:alanine-glyoxylate transaminase/serine-glyoxylate transaminase/serine-pyruvate transaminase
MRTAGRHFLQIPGPSPVPDRILGAIGMPVVDHRGAGFADLGYKVLGGMQGIFKTTQPVIIYPSSGTGAWEAALVNTLSQGDKVLMVETGHFAFLWQKLAEKLGLNAELIETDWRRGADPDTIEQALRADTSHSIKALCVVHNETSTGCTSRIADVRKAMDAAGHPALLMVDTISGLASADFQFDDWGVDVAISGSQKGLMLPPGLSFNAVSEKALAASASAGIPNSYWQWSDMIEANKRGYFPYTPATNLLFGLAEAIDMLHEEGLENVFSRHIRHAAATRKAVEAWGMEVQCTVESEFSPVLTAVRVPDGVDADHLRSVILTQCDTSLGNGLSKVQGKVFRIGHLGDINDVTLLGTLAGIEIGLHMADVPHQSGGAQAAMDYLKTIRL